MNAALSLFELPGLGEVEKLIGSRLESEASHLTQVSSYLLSLGGKRIRPVLTLICGQLFGIKEPFASSAAGTQLLDVAAGIELIHMATLLHDDIIDKSPIRRHKESAFSKFGLDKTLLAGDFLFMRAFGLCAGLDPFIIKATEKACVALTEGEIMETNLYTDEHSVSSSLEIARKKTAALFELSCLSAAHLANAGPQAEKEIAAFGENIGIAFQILDDILDVISTEDLLGKKSGQDLKERKPSLVNTLWLEEGTQLSEKLRQAPNAQQDDEFVQEALLEIAGSPIIAKAKEYALTYSNHAQNHLEEAIRTAQCEVDLGFRDRLQDLGKFIIQRLA